MTQPRADLSQHVDHSRMGDSVLHLRWGGYGQGTGLRWGGYGQGMGRDVCADDKQRGRVRKL